MLRTALDGLPEDGLTVGDVTYGLPGMDDPIFNIGAPGVPEGSGEEEEWLLPDAFEASLNALAIGTYQWNAADRLVRYTDAAGNTTTYRYNGDGHRIYMGISIADGSVQDGYMPSHPAGVRDGWEPQYKKRQMDIYFVNDITQAIPLPLTATDATGTAWKQNYVYGALGERISMSYLPSADSDNGWEPQPGSSGAAPNTPAKTLYYLSDALGSALALQASDGRISARYQYDEFGIPEQPEKFDPNWPGPDNLFGYTGLGYDYYSGLTFANARYFDPTIGRFISEDTYEGELENSLSQHLYTYVLNNPLKYTDPSGHCVYFDWAKQACKWVGDQAQIAWDYTKSEAKKTWNYLKEVHSSWESAVDYWTLGAYSTLKNYYDVSMENPYSIEQLVAFGYVVIEFTPQGKAGKITKKGQEFFNSVSKSVVKGCNCFTAGTKVLTDEGEKPIEEIEVGDKVLAKSDETGEVAYKEVVGLFQKQADEIYYVHIGDEIIEVTGEHLFWLDGQGWTLVKDLKVGDLLVSSDGSKLAIDKIEKESREATVYNFEVEDFHSYFVSNLGIWVHNCTVFLRNITDTSKLDKNLLNNLKIEGTVKAGGRSGGDRALYGTPNSYVKTEAGHIWVYDSDGRLYLDISSE